MRNRTIVRLQITSELSPEQITEKVGISPDLCWLKGDTISPTALRRKTNGWELNSGIGEERALKEHLTTLLLKVRGAEDRLVRLKNSAEILVSCVIYWDSQPDMFVDSELVRSIASIGAALDFDVYIRD